MTREPAPETHDADAAVDAPSDRPDRGVSGGRARGVVFALVVVLVVGAATAFGLGELRRTQAQEDRAPAMATAGLTELGPGPHLVFRHTGADAEYGHVAEASLADPAGPRAFTDVSCDRVAAGGTGASCLRTEPGVVTRYSAEDYDSDWQRIGATDLPGIPSRTRLSPDGSLVATTVFVTGHSYMTTGFSTATVIREVNGRSLGNLESFTLILDGEERAPVDRNTWGVTFLDDRTFYATVATGSKTYLARGDLAARTLTTVADTVECPSLSPDGSRIAFKQVVKEPGGGSRWAPAVLDLASGERTMLDGETRNVDDQLAWLDDDTVLYGLPRPDRPSVTDVWALDLTPGAVPRVLLEEAWSPTVVR
ncbi:hypothetical protein [Nocardioides insulae]|uniref:hypothetical protein n=1 Tax=Nocardioides insulae TaxID=394734 RepID=UPI000411E7D4|nr:hypothetical protein [Nocardioides insulae]